MAVPPRGSKKRHARPSLPHAERGRRSPIGFQSDAMALKIAVEICAEAVDPGVRSNDRAHQVLGHSVEVGFNRRERICSGPGMT